jgi:hypothetical protein
MKERGGRERGRERERERVNGSKFLEKALRVQIEKKISNKYYCTKRLNVNYNYHGMGQYNTAFVIYTLEH